MIHVAHPWLWVLWLPAALVVFGAEARADGGARRRVLRAVVRLLVLALLVAAATDPSIPAEGAPPRRRLVVATEHGEAMGEAGKAEAMRLGRAAFEAARERGAAVSAVAFDRTATAAVDATAGGAGDPLLDLAPADREGPARPAAGLSTAALAFRPDESGTVILLASGRGDLGDLEETTARLGQQGIRVLARALPEATPPPAARPTGIASLDVPATSRGPFDVRGRVHGEGTVRVALLVDGKEVEARTVETARDGDAVPFAFEDVTLAPGRHEVAVAAGPEGAAAAALGRRLVAVEAPPRVLLAVADPPSSLVARALAVQGYDVRPVPPADLGAALLSGAADDADVLALDAEAAEGLSSARQDTLLEAIDRGVGLFLVAGGDAGAWGRLRGTPLQRALALRPLPPPPPSPEPEPAPPPPPDAETPPVEPPEPEKGPGLRAERRPEEARPISLLLVLDRSGSMEGGKLTMAIEGAEKAAATLARTDRLGVLTFADDVTVDVPMTPVAEVRGTLGWTLAAVQAGGQTDIYGALERAGRILATEPSPIRHLLLLTDGRQTGYAVFMHLIRAMAAQGITLTAVGLGRDHDETLLKQLAMAAPHGRYIPADTEREVPTILTRDTERVADRRLREVEEMARIRDREHEGEPPPPEQEKPPPKPPEPATPEPEPAEPPETATPPAPEEEGPALAPLVAIRPHEATAGLPALPSVGPPRRAEPGPGAAVLLRRAEDEPVLGAARFGLGRVLVLALPDDAAGFAPWPGVERLLLQSVRAVRAPAGARTEGLDPRVLPSPGGEVLRIAAAPGASTAPIRVLWSGPEGERDLGLVTPGGETPLALPPLPPGRRATIQLVMDDGDGRRPAGPSVSYLARPRPAPLLRPGDADALARALGPAALDPSAPLFAPAPPQPIRRPLWPWPLVAALALLPLDVAFHRRAGKPA